MLTVIFSTRNYNDTHIEHIKKTAGVGKNIEVIQYINNGEYSLTELYNKGIKESLNNIVIFCHDDIIFTKNGWGRKIVKQFQKNQEYGILGVAGSNYMPNTGRWWDTFPTIYGKVRHQHEGKEWDSIYSRSLGNQLTETINVDGLFFAINKERIKKSFDENIKGFHFYDLDFCVNNYLSGVKIGVTYEVKITHKSIGITNDEWEKNKHQFIDKYNNDLPLCVKHPNIDAFIFIHDQDILLRFEKSNKFKQLKEYTYIFLGDNPTDKLKDIKNIIIAKDLPNNIENYPKFTAFSGWYVLWKNDLIDSTKSILLLEYDVHLADNFIYNLNKFADDKSPMIGFVPFSMCNYHFVMNPDWVSTINEAIKLTYKIDIVESIKKQIYKMQQIRKDSQWMSTNNILMSYKNFINYMTWFEPLIDYIKEDINCGHAQERCLTFYAILKKIKFGFAPNMLKHEQLDSHRTQGHKVEFEEALKRLE